MTQHAPSDEDDERLAPLVKRGEQPILKYAVLRQSTPAKEHEYRSLQLRLGHVQLVVIHEVLFHLEGDLHGRRKRHLRRHQRPRDEKARQNVAVAAGFRLVTQKYTDLDRHRETNRSAALLLNRGALCLHSSSP